MLTIGLELMKIPILTNTQQELRLEQQRLLDVLLLFH